MYQNLFLPVFAGYTSWVVPMFAHLMSLWLSLALGLSGWDVPVPNVHVAESSRSSIEPTLDQLQDAPGCSRGTLYDAVGRRVAETNALGLLNTFSYDGAGRLIRCTADHS